MNTTVLKRKFIWKNNDDTIVLTDPGTQLTAKEVLDFHSLTYPELTNANMVGPTTKDDHYVYEFSSVVGVKG